MLNLSSLTNSPNVLVETLKLVYGNKKYYMITLITAILVLVIYIGLPIYSIPGNSLSLFFATTDTYGILFMLLLALLVGITLSLQIYIFVNELSFRVSELTTGVTAVVSSVIGVLFTSATCALCIGSLFSFLGAGSIILLLEHKLEISALAFLLVISSLYLTSHRIYSCDTCKINPTSKQAKNTT